MYCALNQLQLQIKFLEYKNGHTAPIVCLSPRVSVSEQLKDYQAEQVFTIQSPQQSHRLKFLRSIWYLTGNRKDNSNFIQTTIQRKS